MKHCHFFLKLYERRCPRISGKYWSVLLHNICGEKLMWTQLLFEIISLWCTHTHTFVYIVAMLPFWKALRHINQCIINSLTLLIDLTMRTMLYYCKSCFIMHYGLVYQFVNLTTILTFVHNPFCIFHFKQAFSFT